MIFYLEGPVARPVASGPTIGYVDLQRKDLSKIRYDDARVAHDSPE